MATTSRDQIAVALPAGSLFLLGVGPRRAGLVGLLRFSSMAALVAWMILRGFSLDEAVEGK